MAGHWIAVACADHVRIGRAGGFMQVCHGKATPLRRIQPGDTVAYYSPTGAFGGREPLRAFTAVGIVRDGDPYVVDMGNGFRPYRRDVAWYPAMMTPIRPLLDRLELSAGRANWGYALRFGLVAISAGDSDIIRSAMGVRGDQPLIAVGT